MFRQIRSILMVLAFLVGGSFHQEFCFFRPYLPYGIGLMLCITFLGLDVGQLKPQRMHIWIVLLIQLIGLAFWGIATLLGEPALAEGLFYCGCAPIAAACPVIIHLIRGNVAFCATAMALSHGAFALLMPFIVPLIIHSSELSYAKLMMLVGQELSQIIVAPALLAFLLRALYPGSKAWSAKLRDASLGLWVFNLTVISAVGVGRLLEMHLSWRHILPLGIGAAIVCATGFFLGYRLGGSALKRECSQCLGQKNTLLSLYIAGMGYGSPLAYVAPVFYVFLHNIANAVQVFLAERERREKDVREQHA